MDNVFYILKITLNGTRVSSSCLTLSFYSKSQSWMFVSHMSSMFSITLVYMHSNTHSSHFINHLLLIGRVNGAVYEACAREQTIKWILIYRLHADEHINALINQDIFLCVCLESMHSVIINIPWALPLNADETADLRALIGQKSIFLPHVIHDWFTL